MSNENNKVSASFWIITIILFVWNILGLLSFMAHVSITEEAMALLPQAEQELYTKYPLWTKIVFGLAVFTGFLGALTLLMKRRISKLIFTFSLLAVVVQMSHSLFVAKAADVYGTMSIVMAALVIVIGAISIWYVSYCDNKNWLK